MYGRVVLVIATSWIVSCAGGATEQTGALLAPPPDAVPVHATTQSQTQLQPADA